MLNYEVLYIIQNDIDDEQKAQVVEKFQSLVESLGGSVESIEKWGTRKLAYPIDFKNAQRYEGYYVVMNFKAKEDVPAELDRQLRINDFVLRNMIVKKDA